MNRWNQIIPAAALLALAACDAPTTSDREARPVPPGPVPLHYSAANPFPETNPFGVNVNQVHGDGQTVLDRAHDAGTGWIRVDFDWSLLQPDCDPPNGVVPQPCGPDTLNVSADLANTILWAKQRGLNVLGVLSYAPRWASGASVNDPAPSRYPPDPTMYVWWDRFVKRVANDPRFAHITHWEIWNEPNDPAFLRPTAAQTQLEAYRKLVGYAAPAIRSVQPGDRIVVGALAYATGGTAESDAVKNAAQGWLASVLATEGGSVDVVSLHLYADANPSIRAIRAFPQEMRGRGVSWRWPLWVTEAALPAGHTPQQADLYARRMLDGMAETGYPADGWKKTFYWHLYEDAGGLALLDPARAPRPAYTALQWIAQGKPGDVIYSALVDEGGWPYVQHVGWQGEVKDGATAGTEGRGLEMQALRVRPGSGLPGVQVCYQGHFGNIGWEPEVCGNQAAGAAGKEMQAVRIRLAGAPAGTRVCYQAHVAYVGWQGEVCDGAVAGTVGQGLEMQAVRIRIVR